MKYKSNHINMVKVYLWSNAYIAEHIFQEVDFRLVPSKKSFFLPKFNFFVTLSFSSQVNVVGFNDFSFYLSGKLLIWYNGILSCGKWVIV